MPTPKALPIALSEAQRDVLTSITRHTTNSYRLVRRASIMLLAAAGQSNSNISRHWQLDRNQVRYWRQRWVSAEERLRACEQRDASGKELTAHVLQVLADEQRSGAPPTYTPEQVVGIVAIACEEPQASGRPVNQWSPDELADEAVKRGIVSNISPSSVRRFLKRSRTTAPSESVLAECSP